MSIEPEQAVGFAKGYGVHSIHGRKALAEFETFEPVTILQIDDGWFTLETQQKHVERWWCTLAAHAERMIQEGSALKDERGWRAMLSRKWSLLSLPVWPPGVPRGRGFGFSLVPYAPAGGGVAFAPGEQPGSGMYLFHVRQE